MAGLSAATLAREGFKGTTDSLSGRHGFMSTYAPNPNPERAVQDLGTVFELMATAVKPYPSCRYGHAGIDAVLALRAAHGLRPEQIEQITYGTSKAGMLLVGEPAAKKSNPQNVVDGQFSGPFVMASAMATGKMDWDSYSGLQDPVIRSLLPKFVSEHDPEIEAEFPTNMSGKVTILAGGKTYTHKVVVPKGEPSNFLTEAELRAKFAGLTIAVLGAEGSAALADAVLRLDKTNDVSSLALAAEPLQQAAE
jgi:2-methylcitrate dehydratase PrpD